MSEDALLIIFIMIMVVLVESVFSRTSCFTNIKLIICNVSNSVYKHRKSQLMYTLYLDDIRI